MSAESSGPSGRFTYWRLRFRAWRGNRPFWAGLLTVLSGIPIAYFPYANLTLGHVTLTMATTAGAGALIIGVLLVTLGFTMWFHQIIRVFAGIASILLALVSIPVSNLGGLFIGFLFALIGGALSIAWAPARSVPPSEEADHGGTPMSGPDLGTVPEPRTTEHNEYAPDNNTVEANGGRNSAG